MDNSKTLNLYVKNSQTIPLYVSGFTSSSSISMNISGSQTISFIPSFLNYISSDYSTATVIDFTTPETTSASYILSISASYQDSTGRLKDASFSSGGDVLYVARDTVSTNKSWIPFDTTFGVTNGIHLVSATLKVSAYDTQSYISGAPCKIKVACDKTPNSASPVSWSTLNSKTITTNFYSASDLDTWSEGEVYDIDITSSMKNLVGASAITWTDGSRIAILMQDYGSSVGSYRTVVSSEGADNTGYQEPILELVYEDNYYSDDILDTYIYKISPTLNYSSATQLMVGKYSSNIYRILLKPNISSISAAATVTSASLMLYHESESAAYTTNISAYRYLTNWDLYGASWNRKYGTAYWTSTGGSSLTDRESSYIGTLSLSSTETVGWKTIPLTASLVQEWVSGATTNNGLLLMMDSESVNNRHVFTSSRGKLSSNHPKLVISYTLGGSPYTETFQT